VGSYIQNQYSKSTLKNQTGAVRLPKQIAMDWFIRHRVAGKSSVEVDNYVKNFARTLAGWGGIPVPHYVKNSSFSVDPITGEIASLHHLPPSRLSVSLAD